MNVSHVENKQEVNVEDLPVDEEQQDQVNGPILSMAPVSISE